MRVVSVCCLSSLFHFLASFRASWSGLHQNSDKVTFPMTYGLKRTWLYHFELGNNRIMRRFPCQRQDRSCLSAVPTPHASLPGFLASCPPVSLVFLLTPRVLVSVLPSPPCLPASLLAITCASLLSLSLCSRGLALAIVLPYIRWRDVRWDEIIFY
jgi:hypothetical protein